MRIALILAILPFPATAWEFSPTPICTLSHQNADAEFTVTFDASLPEYALSIRLATGIWDTSPVFQLSFLGANSLQIGTIEHSFSADSTTLFVRDSGFGNVLDGLEFNDAAIASAAPKSVSFDLTNADPAIQAFRECPSNTPATS